MKKNIYHETMHSPTAVRCKGGWRVSNPFLIFRGEILGALLCFAPHLCFSQSPCPAKEGSDTAFRKLPLVFVKNQGQIQEKGSELLFYSWFPQGISIYKDRINIYGTDVKPIPTLPKGKGFQTSSSNSLPSGGSGWAGASLQQGIFNYFGNNKSISNIPSYGEVVYKNIYPYIDLTLAGREQGKIEFIWQVHPGGNVNDIFLEIKGAKIKKTAQGEILVTPKKKNHPSFTIGSIYAYQEKEGTKEKIEVQYAISPLSFGEGPGVRRIGLLASSYDKTKILIIDPVAAIIAGSGNDYAYALAIDGVGGNVFVAGYTDNYSNFAPSRTLFSVTAGADAFVTKLNNALTSHIATAILSGSSIDIARALAIDGAGGNVFVAGYTDIDFPDFMPSRTVFGTTGLDVAFVTKLNNALTSHIATACITGSSIDRAYALAIDGAGGNVFVAGTTETYSDFAPSRTVFGAAGPSYDAFVTQLNNSLTSHISTAIIGSSGNDYAYALAINGVGGSVFAAGITASYLDFAPSRTVFGTAGGIYDAFVTKLDNTLTSHFATAIIASSGDDKAYALVINGAGGNVFAAGYTDTYSNFAPSRTVFGTVGVQNAFVTKLNYALTSHLATGIIAGSGDDRAYALAIDGVGGDVFAAGYTGNYANFAPTRTVLGTTGGVDAFVSKLNNALTSHLATAIITGSGNDYARALVINGAGGNVFAAGYTGNYANFAPSRTVFGTTGVDDAFVTWLYNDLTALPIELLSFSGNCSPSLLPSPAGEGLGVRLNWQTASEQNNDYFEIQRKDGSVEDWKVAGTIKGAGNSSTIRSYEFTDVELPNYLINQSTIYYRLKQTDFDGKSETYGPISVTCEPTDEWQLIAPSICPEGGEYVCTLLLPQDAAYKAEIIDLQGKTISLPFGEGRAGAKGSNLLQIDLKNISSGVYFIHITSPSLREGGGGLPLTKKFVKQ